MWPKLPSAQRLASYLETIDSSRIYSNFGPLVVSLEERLSQQYGLGAGTLTTVANATLGLSLALAAQGARPGTLCAMPAWTFVASAHAATLAGLIPFFVDVDPDTWAIAPHIIETVLRERRGEIGAVMPVAPFGQPIDTEEWDRFRLRTGLAVVIDAAAAFDAIKPGSTPVVVSLHATKALAVGEGGFVMSTDTALISDIRARANFGFHASREARMPATNAKLSEYHAAVGHASLDEWTAVRAEWLSLAESYRKALPESNWLRFQPGFGRSWIASTCNLQILDSAERTEKALASADIETRRWWGRGAHAHQATSTYPRTALATTEALSLSTLGIPFYRDLDDGSIRRIADCVLAARV